MSEAQGRSPIVPVAIVIAVIAAAALGYYWFRGNRAPERAGFVESDTVAVSEPEVVEADPHRFVDVLGRQVRTLVTGSGSPAIVVEPAPGDSMAGWDGVVARIPGDYRVLRYDRAGYGGSDPGAMPRDADQVVNELERLLAASGEAPPYLLVGHGTGAQYALLFADQNPTLAAGVVLLDPPPHAVIKGDRFPAARARALAEADSLRRRAEAARASGNERLALHLETVASERRATFESGWSVAGEIQTIGDIPLVVVVPGRPDPAMGADATAYRDYARNVGEELTFLSSRSRMVFAEDAPRDLPRDAPDVVVDAIVRCINLAREPSDPGYWEDAK